MIVVVGVPAWRAAEPAAPAGRACGVALAAASAGARVELVGRTGDDAAGDALLLALSRAGVGHVAMLRDPARATPITDLGTPEDEGLSGLAAAGSPPPPGASLAASISTTAAPGGPASAAPRLEPADVSLGLQYLTAFGVLVATDDVPAAVLPVVVEAAGFAGAHLVLLLPPGVDAPAALSRDATILGVPDGPDEGAFAALVGAYAAALDGGRSPAEAFAAVTDAAGWEAIRP